METSFHVRPTSFEIVAVRNHARLSFGCALQTILNFERRRRLQKLGEDLRRTYWEMYFFLFTVFIRTASPVVLLKICPQCENFIDFFLLFALFQSNLRVL